MPLQQDISLALMKRESIPAGTDVGYLKRKEDGALAWASVPDGAVSSGDFDPNGILFSYAGDLFKQRGATPALWQNEDGLSTWSPIGGGGFPITFDDGSNTYTIDINGFALRLTAVEDGTPANVGTITIDNGDVDISCLGTNGFYVLNADQNVTMTAQGAVALTAVGGDVNLGAGAQFVLSGTTKVYILGPEIIFSQATAAPASGDLLASEFALWLDDTPGATVLHAKAKDSGGTVRTVSIPLT